MWSGVVWFVNMCERDRKIDGESERHRLGRQIGREGGGEEGERKKKMKMVCMKKGNSVDE